MSEKIRVILADDHIVVLQGLRGLLEQEDDIQVVALVQNGDELLACLEKSEADVVVLDLEMPYHGLTALEEIRKREVPVRVVVLTAFGDGSSIQSALELRAEGFALKTESPIQLIEAIRQVAKGRIIFPAAAQRWLMNQKVFLEKSRSPIEPKPRHGIFHIRVAPSILDYFPCSYHKKFIGDTRFFSLLWGFVIKFHHSDSKENSNGTNHPHYSYRLGRRRSRGIAKSHGEHDQPAARNF